MRAGGASLTPRKLTYFWSDPSVPLAHRFPNRGAYKQQRVGSARPRSPPRLRPSSQLQHACGAGVCPGQRQRVAAEAHPADHLT